MSNIGLDAFKGINSLNALRQIRSMLDREYELVSDLNDADGKIKREMITKIFQEFGKIEDEFLL